MDKIILNPGFQHITEKILLNLPLKDLNYLQLVNKSSKIFLDDPIFWIKKWLLKGLSKKNREDWLKAIQLTKNTKLKDIIVLYIRKVLHRDRIVDMPCHIDEKTVEKCSKFADENAFRKYLRLVFKGQNIIKRSDAGIVQIYIALVKDQNAANAGDPSSLIKHAIKNDYNNIVQVLVPFIGNANAKKIPGIISQIEFAIALKKKESIKLLAPFCDDYSFGGYIRDTGMSLIHLAVIYKYAEAIKILVPYMKTPNAPNHNGVTPIQMATRHLGQNHHIVQILQSFQ